MYFSNLNSFSILEFLNRENSRHAHSRKSKVHKSPKWIKVTHPHLKRYAFIQIFRYLALELTAICKFLVLGVIFTCPLYARGTAKRGKSVIFWFDTLKHIVPMCFASEYEKNSTVGSLEFFDQKIGLKFLSFCTTEGSKKAGSQIFSFCPKRAFFWWVVEKKSTQLSLKMAECGPNVWI